MKQIKLLVAVLSFLISSALTGHAQNAKQEPAPTVSPEMKQDAVKTDAAVAPIAAQPAESPAAQAKQDADSKEKRFVAVVGPDGVQKAEIVGGEYYFNPNHIVVKVNVPVSFSVKKGTDSSWFIPHDIAVKSPEAGINFVVPLKKEPQTVTFTPTKTGTYTLFCDKKSPFGKTHKEKGMEGVIEVVP